MAVYEVVCSLRVKVKDPELLEQFSGWLGYLVETGQITDIDDILREDFQTEKISD